MSYLFVVRLLSSGIAKTVVVSNPGLFSICRP